MITPSAWEPAPDNGVSQCMLAFCSHIFLLQMTPTSLSPKMTWFVGGGGVHFAKASHAQVEAALSFLVPRVLLSQQHEFLVEIFVWDCKRAFSFI